MITGSVDLDDGSHILERFPSHEQGGIVAKSTAVFSGSRTRPRTANQNVRRAASRTQLFVRFGVTQRNVAVKTKETGWINILVAGCLAPQVVHHLPFVRFRPHKSYSGTTQHGYG